MKTTPKTTAKITKQKRTILIADDQPAHLEAITATLQYAPEEYYVISVQNGREACEVAEREQPDLIIMDWMMPEMDGFEALQHLKKQPNTSEIPVIMLTSLDSSKRIEQAFTAGANDYIRSPIDKLELQARVRSTLALSESYKQIKEQAHRLELRNQEIAQQRELLEQQAVEIRVANAKLQQANKSLQLKNSQLTELNYEKNELLGIAAHDLKNPISNIRMLAQILLTEADTLSLDERREYSSDILTDAAKMYDLVMKLLDISAIESGVMKLNLTLFDLGVAAHSVTENYHGRAAKKNIIIHFQSWPNALPVYADQTATMQVLDNLISNAVKYSPFDTNVYVRASEVENSGGEKISRVEVQDEGPGLNEEDKKRLFGKFAKLSAQPTGGENSTGLGLSIAKKIIETMNGRIWCESEEGHGAMFVIELPQS